jgi:hypothetical protein
MQYAWFWNPLVQERRQPLPIGACALAASKQNAAPQPTESTARCDFSITCMSALWFLAFSDRPPHYCRRRVGDLPVLVHVVSQRAWVLRLRRTGQPLAVTRLPFCLPRLAVWSRHPDLPAFVGSRSGAMSIDWFPDPATSNVECGFPALRSPAGFSSRPIRHQEQERLSKVPIFAAGNRCRHLAHDKSTLYSTVSSPCLCVTEIASDDVGSSFLTSL